MESSSRRVLRKRPEAENETKSLASKLKKRMILEIDIETDSDNGSKQKVRKEEKGKTMNLNKKTRKKQTKIVDENDNQSQSCSTSKKCDRKQTKTESQLNTKHLKTCDITANNCNLQSVYVKTDFTCNFDNRKTDFHIKGAVSTVFERSLNIFHLLHQNTFGLHAPFKLKKSCTQPVVKNISEFGLCRCASPFDRKTTALEWHPTNPDKIVVGSKGGDIILWDTSTVNKDLFIHGGGPGESVQAMKFWPWDITRVASASVNGTITIHNFEGRQNVVLADTMNYCKFWYCSLDISKNNKLLVAGDNVGTVLCLSEKGDTIWNTKLHKQKVTHVEFSPRESWLFCTASVDHTVKLWDIRMIKDAKSSLQILTHTKGVNSAYFSETDGCRLLTTDQHSELRIFSAPDWRLERTIIHPHRFFQHLTPIKATWHPLQDLIVIGRYPDPSVVGDNKVGNDRRTIDILDADSGDIVTKLYDPSAPGIISLNKFNKTGESLVSGMGVNILLWNRKDMISKKQEHITNQILKSGVKLPDLMGNNPQRRRQPPSNGDKKTKTKTVKSKTFHNTKTKTKKP